MKVDFDVIIVGAGIAGALCAYKLSQHEGARILLIDPGVNEIDPEDGMEQRMAFRTAFALAPTRGSSQIATYAEDTRDRYAPSVDGLDVTRYLVQTKPPEPNPQNLALFKVPYQRLVGGSTWSWRGNVPRMIPSDFELKKRYGLAVDWPFGYTALEPWYCEAEKEMGVSGNDEEWGKDADWVKAGIGGTRSQQFPMPHIVQSFSDQQVIAALGPDLEIEGKKIRVVSTPQARNSRKYDGRSECLGNSNCIPICPSGAKYDAGVHLRKAFKNGAQIRKHSVVVRLEPGTDGNVQTVVFRDWRQDPSREQRLTARIVVLAANAIESPKIWLMSNLGNKSDQVGRNLTDHLQQEVVGLFPVPIYPFRGPQGLSSIEVFRDGPFRKDSAAFRMSIGNDGWGRYGLPATVVDQMFFRPTPDGKPGVIGKEFKARAADRLSRMLRISFSTEQLPNPENRVTLSDKKDDLGVPRPQIAFRLDEYSKRAFIHGHLVAKQILFSMRVGAARVTEIQPDLPEADYNTAAHAMGTLRMGDSDRTSVVNGYGLSHEHKNLYVLGSSVFPTAATANPTLTIAALALRTAEEIAKRL